MAVDTVSSATSTTATSSSKASSAAASASLDYDAFLQLLIAQMQNQDPTDPLDASEQISQLATFSQVEQSIQTNTNLESLIAQSSLSNASSYIGKTITSADGSKSGVVASVEVTSEGLSATTTSGSSIAIGQGIKISQTAS